MIPCGCSGCVQVGAGECSNLVSATRAGGPVSQDYSDLKQENTWRKGLKAKELEPLQPPFTEIVHHKKTRVRSSFFFGGGWGVLWAQHPLEFVCLCSPWPGVNGAQDKQCRAKKLIMFLDPRGHLIMALFIFLFYLFFYYPQYTENKSQRKMRWRHRGLLQL